MEVTTDGSTELSYNAIILMKSTLRQATLVLLNQAGEEMSKDHFKLAASHCSFQKSTTSHNLRSKCYVSQKVYAAFLPHSLMGKFYWKLLTVQLLIPL